MPRCGKSGSKYRGRPLLLLAATLAVAPLSADILDPVNEVRMSGCGEFEPVATPLQHDERLDEAAARLAAGVPLNEAIDASGYRANRMAHIRIGFADAVQTRRFLQQDFCAIVADPALLDAGRYTVDDETWAVFAAPVAITGGEDPATAGRRLVTAINDARGRSRNCGGTPLAAAAALARNATLDAVAQEHAHELARRGELSHESADGRSPAERVMRAGYRYRAVAENVAAGQTGAEQVVETWLGSSGHCRNPMNARYTETGVGVAIGDDERGIYWVQVYAAPE
jgi:uncharacterized protein YkwD